MLFSSSLHRISPSKVPTLRLRIFPPSSSPPSHITLSFSPLRHYLYFISPSFPPIIFALSSLSPTLLYIIYSISLSDCLLPFFPKFPIFCTSLSHYLYFISLFYLQILLLSPLSILYFHSLQTNPIHTLIPLFSLLLFLPSTSLHYLSSHNLPFILSLLLLPNLPFITPPPPSSLHYLSSSSLPPTSLHSLSSDAPHLASNRYKSYINRPSHNIIWKSESGVVLGRGRLRGSSLLCSALLFSSLLYSFLLSSTLVRSTLLCCLLLL